jgi:hypothetical protein
MDGENLLNEKDQEKLYLLHHMHHFESGKGVVHDLHHCDLFSQKNMRGSKLQIKHLLIGKKLFHVLNTKHIGHLYDHNNNEFEIKEKNIDDIIYYVIKQN